jgi:hypothetical protein
VRNTCVIAYATTGLSKNSTYLNLLSFVLGADSSMFSKRPSIRSRRRWTRIGELKRLYWAVAIYTTGPLAGQICSA